MRWFCLIRKHNYKPKKTFSLSIVDENGKHLHWVEMYRGEECIDCCERRVIKVDKNYYHKTVTEQAYEWVQEQEIKDKKHKRPPRKNPGLTLVK